MNKLFYDDRCPLCLNTIKFLKSYIKPNNIQYIGLCDASLEKDILERAFNEMLLVSSNKEYFWGYDSYCRLLMISKI